MKLTLTVNHFILLLASVFLGVEFASAQWIEQRITLRPGWNAVHLKVDPEPRRVTEAFAGLPIRSVWRWNERFKPVKFIQDSTNLIPENPAWLSYFDSSERKPGAVNNLFVLEAGQCYLIELGGAKNVNWTVSGRPLVKDIEWLANSFNLVGLTVSGAEQLTFADYFAPSPSHAGKDIYQLSTSGVWAKVAPTAKPSANMAYWVFCDGESRFQGPMRVDIDQGRVLDFGRVVQELNIHVKNQSSREMTVNIAPGEGSETPATHRDTTAGGVALTVYEQDFSAEKPRKWIPFPETLTRILQAGETATLRIGVDRTLMNKARPDGVEEYLYRKLLKVTSSTGTELFVPVVARGLDSTDRIARGNGAAAPEFTGLWVGSALINRVSQPIASNPDEPLRTQSEAQFRLIVHVDEGGTARLLQQVLLMREEGDTDENGNLIKEGRRVLITDDALISNFGGAALRDGQPVARRFSSVAFAFDRPQEQADGAFGSSILQFSLQQGYDDPLNPYKHKFHPDHDNLDSRFEGKLPEGRESFDFGRVVSLEFTDEDPDDLALPGFGDNMLAGNYKETISGVHKRPIHVQGTFRLHRAARIGTLNQ
ncbi:MAG: hypothetical protein R3F19_17700 [Verrucomicrobiales bacterium]